MPSIWRKVDDEWSLASPRGFSDEAALQSQIEDAPGILPLAGTPRLAVVGREVRVGSGSADLIAVEFS